MPIISRIEPTLPQFEIRKRVAAYARVSMECETLEHSFSAQVSYYSSFIQSNPEWVYKGVYSDYGITGRNVKKRDGFNKLIADCDAGEIDLVLVKSISRFARDTVDTLKTTRHLKEKGIDVYFERENIHSMSDEGELLLTLLASFAQEESRSISQNVAWRIRKKFEQGIPNGHKAPYGYRWAGDCFRIIPEQGDVVKEIYRRYLAGEPAYRIAKNLKDRGIRGQSGIPMDDSTIKDIVTNVSYTGTMILQKNYFTEGHVRKQNNGELPRYAVEGMFEPLATEDDVSKAVAIREERAEHMPNRNHELTVFSGLVRCEGCGCSFSRRTTKYGKKWNCNTRERKGKSVCEVRPIYETELIEATCSALTMDDFKPDLVRRQLAEIVVGHEYITFKLQNGYIKKVTRKYNRGHGVFSQKLVCGCCEKPLLRDTWKFGPIGNKVPTNVWTCRACSLKRVLESEIVNATVEVLKEKDFEARFQQQIDCIIVSTEFFIFKEKDGEEITWKRR